MLIRSVLPQQFVSINNVNIGSTLVNITFAIIIVDLRKSLEVRIKVSSLLLIQNIELQNHRFLNEIGVKYCGSLWTDHT